MTGAFKFPWNAVVLAVLAAVLAWFGVAAVVFPLLLAAGFLVVRAVVEWVVTVRRKRLARAGW